ncbi:glycosyltransferase family 61 protein [Spirosoma rigui]|uniref:glycosyltransferase family 61 protein n=1 Tax=Spirosoma rigui TaxID=564064 RepID=UPI0009B0175C|nr:glycosyltransferase family 61 protein [Spirosoma rigui]
MIRAIKKMLKDQLVGWGKELGVEVLNREQSVDFLASYLVSAQPGDQITLPAVYDFTDTSKRIFTATEAVSEPVYVWHYKADPKKASLLHCGALFAEGKILCMDWHENRQLFRDFVRLKKRAIRDVDTVIAPWSHYLDGIQFGGYYDYLVLVAGKLCRIKESVSEEIFCQSSVAYPLFNTTYERELLALIGFGADRIFDSRLTSIRFNNCIVSNSGHWFYPNMEDLMALKRHIEQNLKPPVAGRVPDRLYISRSGRRRVQNEPELIRLLEKYDIKVIRDEPRTIAEQVEMYQNASFIIGPHGASFSNILWCKPGTQLVELFSANYVPDFFLYMAKRLGLQYYAYHHGSASSDRFSQLEEDIVVSIPDLDRSLQEFFTEKTSV